MKTQTLEELAREQAKIRQITQMIEIYQRRIDDMHRRGKVDIEAESLYRSSLDLYRLEFKERVGVDYQ